MNPIADLDESAFRRAFLLATAVGCRTLDIASVWFSESGWHSSAHNPHGDASGLCQMMPARLLDVGYIDGWRGFVRLTAAEQIQPWILRYYRPHAGKMASAELAYLATFLPAYLNPAFRARNGIAELTPETVIASRNGRLGWAYTANAVFDADGNGEITLGELGVAIRRNCVGARWQAIAENVARISKEPEPAPQTIPDGIDLAPPHCTTLTVQRALNLLPPYPALTTDGSRGPRTIAAIRAFQLSHQLTPDGLVGPLTRAALEQALQAARSP